MRASLAGSLPLLGSLGLHGCVLLLLFAAVRTTAAPIVPRARAEAWPGSAVEVDAVATPDGVPTIANTESPPAIAPGPAAPAPEVTSASEPAPLRSSAPEQHAEPVPVPRKRAQRAKPPEADAAANVAQQAPTATNGTDGHHKPATQAETGAFGAQDLPPGVRSLPSAFTRAIPPATAADPVWQTLPTGSQRPFTIAVRIDADGHIQDSKILGDHQGNSPPEQFVHLRERVVALLGAGLFALHGDVTSGYGVFRISITLSDRAVKDDAEPAELVERGFEPPRGPLPGHAYFTLASGRHFDAKVEILDAQHAR